MGDTRTNYPLSRYPNDWIYPPGTVHKLHKIMLFWGEVMATTSAESLGSGSKSKLFLGPIASFTADSTSAAPISQYQPLADDMETLTGTYDQRLVFLHQDDWSCSADSQNFSTEFFDRHFFFPTDC